MECENGAFTLVLKGTLSLYYFAALKQDSNEVGKYQILQMPEHQIPPELFHRFLAILPHFGRFPLILATLAAQICSTYFLSSNEADNIPQI